MTTATAPSAPARDVLLEIEGYTARITLNRPDALNAYATDTLRGLAAAFREASDDDRVAVIVFTGAGTRAFGTGGDVKEYAARYTAKPRDYWKYMGLFRAYLEAILDSGKPVIARVNGMAVGGGNESHLACDLSIAAEHAVFRQVGTSVGSVACGGATQWLPLAIGDRRAREMLFLNEPVPARKALAWGLVNEVVPSVTRNGAFVGEASPEEIGRALRGEEGYAIDLSRLDEAVARLGGKLYEKFPECARYTKEQVNYWKNLAWHQTVGHARDWLALHFACAETHEGMRAFVEKRRVDYRGLRERIAAGGNGEFPAGPLTAACPACGVSAQPAGFAFCGACGERLARA
jgi:enoyl-CoA hydratase/carnithine racemase